jgi:para-nitrobenzyl esterase
MNRYFPQLALSLALGLGTLPAHSAQAAASAESATYEYDGRGHAKLLAIREVTAKIPAALTVTSPAFSNGGDIPFENTVYRGNKFPGLSWNKGPAGTRSYVAVMQGAVAGGDDLGRGTSIHFVMYNIPAELTRLDAGMTKPPAEALHGNTVHKMADLYAGPHTHNFVKHAYHFQVLALDRTVPASDDMTLGGLETLMAGHVLAAGEVVGYAAMDPESDEGKAFAAKQAASKSTPAQN